MVGWHHWLNGHEFAWTPGVGDGQGGLVCCSPWGHKELDTTEWLDWTESFYRSLVHVQYVNFCCTTRWISYLCSFFRVFSHRSLQCWVESPAGSHWLYIVVCMCQSQSSNLQLLLNAIPWLHSHGGIYSKDKQKCQDTLTFAQLSVFSFFKKLKYILHTRLYVSCFY